MTPLNVVLLQPLPLLLLSLKFSWFTHCRNSVAKQLVQLYPPSAMMLFPACQIASFALGRAGPARTVLRLGGPPGDGDVRRPWVRTSAPDLPKGAAMPAKILRRCATGASPVLAGGEPTGHA